MSHLSQFVCEAIANATGVGGSPPLHQPDKDRVQVFRDREPTYVVCISERERLRIEAALEIAYGEIDSPIPEGEFGALRIKFSG